MSWLYFTLVCISSDWNYRSSLNTHFKNTLFRFGLSRQELSQRATKNLKDDTLLLKFRPLLFCYCKTFVCMSIVWNFACNTNKKFLTRFSNRRNGTKLEKWNKGHKDRSKKIGQWIFNGQNHPIPLNRFLLLWRHLYQSKQIQCAYPRHPSGENA